jgi:L-aminopeptidase/D-esterase-like protein
MLNNTLVDIIGLAAQDAIGKAIKNSILHAESIPGFPAI